MKINSSILASAVALSAIATGAMAEPVVSGRMFYDLTSVNKTVNGVKQNGSGTGLDVTRFYVGVDNKFTDILSGNVTLDFQQPSGANGPNNTGNGEVFVKKAWVKAKFNDMLEVSAGANDMPWVPYVEDLYGYRYLQTVAVDRTKFGTSTDWGLFAKGNLNEYLSYSVAAVNGNGYRKAVRGASMDYEGRLTAKYNHLQLSIGGYTGKLGTQKSSTNTFVAGDNFKAAQGPVRTATRSNILGAFKGDRFTLGLEGFKANNYSGSNPVALTATTVNKANGASIFTSYRVTPQVTVFGRYDNVITNFKPVTGVDSIADTKDSFYTTGVSYNLFRNVDFTFAVKNTTAKKQGTATTKTNEAGIWAQYRF